MYGLRAADQDQIPGEYHALHYVNLRVYFTVITVSEPFASYHLLTI